MKQTVLRHLIKGCAAIFLIFGAITPSLAGSGICSQANIDGYFAATQNRTTVIDKASFYRAAVKTFPEYKEHGRHFRGTDAILDRWNSDERLKDARWLAYILATSYHETAQQMFPVREHLAVSDDAAIQVFKNNKIYNDTTYWKKNSETGEHYFGRGYVQLTWDYNYKRADLRFNTKSRRDSFYWHPDLALEPKRAIDVTYDGMVYGWFTGHCLLMHFQPNRRADWRNARRIINGIDRSDLIKSYAVQFLKALDQSSIPSGNAASSAGVPIERSTVTAPSLAVSKRQDREQFALVAMEARSSTKRKIGLVDKIKRASTSRQEEISRGVNFSSSRTDEAEASGIESEDSSRLSEFMKNLHAFFIWISPVLACIVWLFAQLLALLALALEWISEGLIALSEWVAQFGEPDSEKGNS